MVTLGDHLPSVTSLLSKRTEAADDVSLMLLVLIQHSLLLLHDVFSFRFPFLPPCMHFPGLAFRGLLDFLYFYPKPVLFEDTL